MNAAERKQAFALVQDLATLLERLQELRSRLMNKFPGVPCEESSGASVREYPPFEAADSVLSAIHNTLGALLEFAEKVPRA